MVHTSYNFIFRLQNYEIKGVKLIIKKGHFGYFSIQKYLFIQNYSCKTIEIVLKSTQTCRIRLSSI